MRGTDLVMVIERPYEPLAWNQLLPLAEETISAADLGAQ